MHDVAELEVGRYLEPLLRRQLRPQLETHVMERVVAPPVVRHVGRGRALAIGLHLLARERAGQVLLDVGEEPEAAQVDARAQHDPQMAVQSIAALSGMGPEPVQVRAGVARVVVEGVEDLAARELTLEESARSALRVELDGLGGVPGPGLEVDGPAQRAASVPERVAALVDLHVRRRQDLQ